jgi:hypothetical protein
MGVDRTHQANHFRSGELSRLHAGLMVGVHIHQLGVDPNRTLKQGDQRSETALIQRGQSDQQTTPAPIRERGARAMEKAGKKITAAHALAGRNERPRRVGIAQHFNESSEEVVWAVE